MKKKTSSAPAKRKRRSVKRLPEKKVSIGTKPSSPIENVPLNERPKPFPIVGFGASAGGLDAFTKVLRQLHSDLGMAYVLIMHLSPNHKSALAEILRSKTNMPIQTVKDGMEIMANNVYVIPPNTYMSLVDGHFKLAPRALTSIGNYAVDYFLTALASIYKNNSIGVILSGTASDGTLGLKAIKAEGGITFAQDDTAEFSGMPRNANDSGYVDFMLPPEEIAKELARLVKLPYTILPSDTIEAVQVKELRDHSEDLKKILTIVKNKSGIDFFNHYKHASIYRRVIRRMVLNKFEKLPDYCSMLKANPKEVESLFNDFLINVTNFFRDPEFYKVITSEVFPAILKQGKSIDPIRIWVAGCATGEEAYSIAICLIEFLEKVDHSVPVQIFASDLDADAIEKARSGIYPVSALQGVSPERLKRYFKKLDGHYQLVKAVREICIFSQHNLLKDPPFSRMDLISCQNVLIYLEVNPQKKILQTFHYALKPTGYLFLGKSETTGAASEMFEAFDKKIKLYTRKAVKSPQLEFSVHPVTDTLALKSQSVVQREDIDVEKEMSQLMLSRFVHPGVVVNKNMVITQFFGITSPYLAPVTGKASFNILKMIREDLLVDLRGLLQEARKTGNGATKENILIFNKKVSQEISIEVVPKKTLGDIFFLVVFKEHAAIKFPMAGNGAILKSSTDQKQKTIVKLREELVQSIEVIRTTSEEYETTYEELQANNEEVLSSNEELQSVNEELEASKEELQSANEELITINEELSKRNIELKESRNYAEAIVETVHSPFLVLMADLNVRMANKAFYETFGLTQEETEGSLIYSLGNNAWDIPDLREHLKEIFPKNSNFKDFEIKHTFPGLGKRELIVNAYRLLKGEDSNETLILLAFDDITRRIDAEASLLKTQEQLKLSLVGDSIGTWWWNLQTGEMQWSRENELLNGMKEGTFRGLYKDWESLIHPDDIPVLKEAIKTSFYERLPIDVEYRIIWPDRTVHWMLSKGHPYFDPYGKPERMIGVSMDSTERKIESENLESQVNVRTAELQNANKALRIVNDQLEQFAFISSHDLQEPLRKIQTFSSLLSNSEAHLNAYAQKYSDKINTSASRMSALLKDLLSFSILIKTDKEKFTKVELNETVKNVISDFEVTIDMLKADVTFSPLPVIQAEPVQMNQLFHNLIGNALKFGRENPVISISSHEVDEEERSNYPELKKNIEYVAIRVTDNGIGFDQKYVHKIFTLFQRLGDKKGVDGTGMGLAISKKIVEDHGGYIYASGKLNEGAIFTVFLPTEIQPAEQPPPPPGYSEVVDLLLISQPPSSET